MKGSSTAVTPQGYPVMLSPVSPPQPAAAPALRGSPRLYKAMLGLAATQIVLVVALMSWVAVLWAKHSAMGHWGFTYAAGVGVVVITTGGIGIAASKHRNKCLIITFMIMCIISAALVGSLLIPFSIGLAVDTYEYRERLETYDYDWVPDYYGPDCDYNYYEDVAYGGGNMSRPCPVWDVAPMIEEIKDSQYRLVLAMYSLVLIFSVMQVVVAVVASAFSCKAICNCQQHVYPSMHIAYMVQMPGGYQQPRGQLFVPTVGQTEQPKKVRPVIMQPHDMYPIDIPIEQWDVSPTQSRPPSYTSLRVGEEDEDGGKGSGAVGKVQVV